MSTSHSIIALIQSAIAHVIAHRSIPPRHILEALVSQGLGLGIVLGSFLVKLPQILKLINSSSAVGLQPSSFEIETVCALVAATYGFVNGLSFSAFGEAVGLALQNIILLGLIYKYQKRSKGRVLGLACVVVSWLACARSGLLTKGMLDRLVDVNSVVLLISRIPQILSNYKAKNTGQLSFLTYFLNFMGTVARVFTTMKEKNATSAMMRGVFMSMSMNLLIVLQIVVYGGKVERKKKKA